MSIFHYQTYKAAISGVLDEQKRSGRNVTLSALAMACRVQKPYLSRGLNHDGHLNSDQLYLASEYLGLNEKENKYLSLLHEMDRSELPVRKNHFQKQADRLKSKAIQTENYLSAETLDFRSPELNQYHLNPLLQLVHFFLTVPRFSQNQKALEEKLNLSREELQALLNDLVKMRLIEMKDKKWRVLRDSIHLSRDAPIYHAYRVLQRVAVLQKLQQSKNKNDYSFSVVFTATPKTRRLVQEKFMDF